MLSLGTIAVMLSSVNAVRHTPITVVSQSTAERENNSEFNRYTFRDGGASTFVNGFHLQVFQDSKTCKIPDFNDPSCAPFGANFTSMVHNSIGYFGYVSVCPALRHPLLRFSTDTALHSLMLAILMMSTRLVALEPPDQSISRYMTGPPGTSHWPLVMVPTL